MKILPTKAEFNALRSASEKLETICTPGKKCENCFMNEHIDGESCCPASHIISNAEKIKNELIEKFLDFLPKEEQK